MNKRLKNQVLEYIASTIEGYLNGCYDDNYDPMTKEQYIDYVIEGLRMDVAAGMIVNGEEFKHLYFYGLDKIKALTADYIDNYDDIKPYLL